MGVGVTRDWGEKGDERFVCAMIVYSGILYVPGLGLYQ